MRQLLREDSLSFYCELCDLEWTPSDQELANVDLLLNPAPVLPGNNYPKRGSNGWVAV
jgi:hypothetical protein